MNAPVPGQTITAPLLEVGDLKVHFPIRGGLLLRIQNYVRALDGVTLSLMPGETLGVVGESGCGKSTLAKAIVRLVEPTHGTVRFGGEDLLGLKAGAMRRYRQDLQLIFQDPAESLNARHNVGRILEEPLVIHGVAKGEERRERVAELLETVGLPASSAERFPFEFSGGQRQRIGIARALALDPKLVICDEPVSALDVSIQSQILNLLVGLQEERGLSYLFIAHDLAVVKHISDRIAVMYLGRVVELATANDLHRSPRHPYTRALLDAIPLPDPTVKRERQILTGDVPSPINPPSGCPFHPRCPHAEDRCRVERPELRSVAAAGEPEHTVACHFDL